MRFIWNFSDRNRKLDIIEHIVSLLFWIFKQSEKKKRKRRKEETKTDKE